MTEFSSSERFDLWNQFLQRWPIEKLKEMTLEDYNTLGSKDSFCYWLEARTAPLGSIWGGSSFKFGIFEFNPKAKNASGVDASSLKDDKYKWMKKYGTSANDAFEKIKDIIVSIAKAASEKNFALIDKADFGHATKWKIAFLYQNQENPQLVCVYKKEKLLTM